MQRSAVRLKRSSVAGMFAVVLCLAGCASAPPGSELAVKPPERPLPASQGRVVRLPSEEKFSIALAPSRREPGIDGSADAQSSASGAGQAEATAQVKTAGAASASFQLGHGFKNDSDRQQDVDVRVTVDYEYSVDATPRSARSDASVGLALYARDALNRVQRTITLVQHTTGDGAASSADQKDARFTLTLGPNESTNIFLAGVIDVKTQDGHNAGGRLKVKQLEMEITVDPAPPVSSAPSGQPG